MKKQIIKNIKHVLRPLKNKIETDRNGRYDRDVFLRGYVPNIKSASNQQIRGHLLLHSHALEKSMSYDNFQAGFGGEALEKLADSLTQYERKKGNKQAFAYQYALSAIVEYRKAYQKHGFDEAFLQQYLGKWFERAVTEQKLAGFKFITKNPTDNLKKDFKKLFKERYSVREYANKKVGLTDLKKAIELATKAPSACNRQSARAYITTDQQKIKELFSVHTGFRGYALPPALILITADNTQYVSSIEHNQGYVDGGLFAMSVLLSLEYYGLAACSLNAMFNIANEKKVRQIMQVSPADHLIMFIAVGHFKSQNKVALSSRYPVDEIVKVVK